jgi:hypothetical protein
MYENQEAKTGIPYHIRVAVLLKRQSMDQFLAKIQLTTELSGLSFSSFMETQLKDDPVLFDPYMLPINRGTGPIDTKNISRVDLSSLTEITMHTTVEEIQQIGINEREARQEVEELLSHAAPNGRSIPIHSPAKTSNSESWYVELWNMELKSEKQWSRKRSVHNGMDSDRFPQFLSKPLAQKIEESDLKLYFPWINESPVGSIMQNRVFLIAKTLPQVTPTHDQAQDQKGSRICNLMFVFN